MKKYAYWNAVLSIPASAILILIGAWVFINSADKTEANGYFIAGLLVGVFGIIWFFINRKISNQKVS
jgi:Na+/melibiose symporter-like transporter